MQKHIHIAFIDEQFINIISPLLDSAIESHELILFIEQSQQSQANAIKNVLTPRAIKVTEELMPSTRNTEVLVDFYHHTLDHLISSNPNNRYVFNASCGDRQHVLSLYEVIKAYQLDCFMVEPKTDQLHWLTPTERTNTQLADKLKITDFFPLIGCDITEISNAHIVEKKYRDLGAKWSVSQDDFSKALGQLNYLAASSEDNNLLSAPLSRQQLNCPQLQTLIDDLEDAELLTREGEQLCFSHEEARFFANGGWLEEYVYGLLLSLKKEVPELQDIAQGVAIKRKVGSGFVHNELDIVILANNKLHLIECKTKKFERGEGNQVIYKLDSLSDLLGGIQARAALVSYKGIRTSEKLRAKELEIALMCEEDLVNLKANLKNWLQNA